jgi:60 kDa SS-A/Ro ribonucleoprotein
MKTNTPPKPIRTHEGGRAKRINPLLMLRRSVMACLLWEREFYEDGEDIAARIAALVPLVDPKKVAEIAVEARTKMKLRHVPLWIVRQMAAIGTSKVTNAAGFRNMVAPTLAAVIQRPDELMEFVSLYWREKKQPLSAGVKKGLAAAFRKFNEYQFAKWNGDGAIKLRDVLFLCHPKPESTEQEALFKKIANKELTTPDTWEVSLSAGKDKAETFTRLITENKLGALALLRNLRNMLNASVPDEVIRAGLNSMKTERVLPFRFIAAARYAPRFEPELEAAMFRCLADAPKLPGHTALLVDVSGSMNHALSGKSDMMRTDAAYGLAMLLREICETVSVFSFSMKLCEIPTRRGFALRDAIDGSQSHEGTPLGVAIKSIYAPKDFRGSAADFGMYGRHSIDYRGQGLKPDRLIVLTDEQAADPVSDPETGRGYMVNVASAKNGVGYGAWLHVDGWSEAIISYIAAYEEAGLT